jgi:CheY-like chemotaxis protein
VAKVLVVDDSVDTARALGLLLNHHGYHVDLAHDGEAALVMLESSLPALIILDLMMPGIDGGEVLRRVREDPRTQRVPIVMFSAAGDPAVREHLLAKGAQEYWLKANFKFDRLAPAVARLIEAGAAGR